MGTECIQSSQSNRWTVVQHCDIPTPLDKELKKVDQPTFFVFNFTTSSIDTKFRLIMSGGHLILYNLLERPRHLIELRFPVPLLSLPAIHNPNSIHTCCTCIITTNNSRILLKLTSIAEPARLALLEVFEDQTTIGRCQRYGFPKKNHHKKLSSFR